MSLEQKIAEAVEVDYFACLSEEEKLVSDIMADIAIQIHHLRADMGMTQKEFAKHIGVSQTMVSKWESCEYNFSIQALAKISAKLGASVRIIIEPKEGAAAAL